MKVEKSVKITGMIIIGVIILGLIVFFGINNIINTNSNTVSVSGESTIEVMPDLVSVYFSINTQGATSQEAADKNTQISNNLTNSLIAIGFNKSQIQTESYSVSPEYDWSTGVQKLKDYIATESIKVQISANDSGRIGDVVDAGINAGAGIDYINFELSQDNQNKDKAEAIKLAAQDATSKAQALAEGIGKNLGSLVSVSVDNYNYAPMLAYNAAGATTADIQKAVPTIQPGNQEISASVTAIYRI